MDALQRRWARSIACCTETGSNSDIQRNDDRYRDSRVSASRARVLREAAIRDVFITFPLSTRDGIADAVAREIMMGGTVGALAARTTVCKPESA